MLSATTRLSRLRLLAVLVTVAGVALGVAAIVLGVLRFNTPEGIWLVLAGVAVSVMVTVAAIIVRLALKIESNTSRLYNQVFDLFEQVQRHGTLIGQISENTSISDAAKSVAHRSREREALRGAIYEEVRREDFEAAFHLIDDLESRLGYREEAENIREETRSMCADALRDKLRAALDHVHKLLDEASWDRATNEIERLNRLIPNESRVNELWQVLEEKREERKQALMRQWNQAIQDSNVEMGIDTLKELDQYVSREEAAAMQATARDLFKERLLQLGISFQFAVKERRWRDALAAGLQIVEEFPNSRMAKEVDEHMAALRSRAGIPSDVEVIAKSTAQDTPADAAS